MLHWMTTNRMDLKRLGMDCSQNLNVVVIKIIQTGSTKNGLQMKHTTIQCPILAVSKMKLAVTLMLQTTQPQSIQQRDAMMLQLTSLRTSC